MTFDPRELKQRGLRGGEYFLPYNPALVEQAREMRKNMTPAESKLWFGFLRNFKFRVLRQRPIDHFIVDFYCAALKLVIEVDGAEHFTDDGKAQDEQRTQVLEGYGLTVIRFSNHQIETDFGSVCQQINSYSHQAPELP